MKSNILIKGENKEALQWLLDNGYRNSIDLVYIDPPYATGATFGIDSLGRAATISKANDIQIAYSDSLKGKEFIAFLKERVALIYELLSDRGALYLHIDYKIGHYVKVMLDEIFGMDGFRNDITRVKCNPKNFDRVGYGNVKDLILFYTKGDSPIWNKPMMRCSVADIEKIYNKVDSKGRRYTTVPIHAPGETKNGDTNRPFKGVLPPKGRHWRCSVEELEELDAQGLIEWSSNGNPRKINYADNHMERRVQDIWDFKDPMYPIYPTEKNVDMLKLIVKASSNEGSIVMDCFCGSGSMLKAADDLGRAWIGVDQSPVAIDVVKSRFPQDGLLITTEYEYVEL